MKSTRIGDTKPIWGDIPAQIPVKVPSDVVRWKIRVRPQSFAIITMTFNNRIEQWYLGQKDDALVPYMKHSVNQSK